MMNNIPSFAPYLIEAYINYIFDVGGTPSVIIRVHESSHDVIKELVAKKQEMDKETDPLEGLSIVIPEDENREVVFDDEGMHYTIFTDDDEVALYFNAPPCDICSIVDLSLDICMDVSPEIELHKYAKGLLALFEKKEEVVKRRASLRVVK